MAHRAFDAAVLGGAARAERMSYRDAVRAGKEVYWRFMGYSLLFVIALLALEVLAIIILVICIAVGNAVGGSLVAGALALLLIPLFIVACFALIGRWVMGQYILAREKAGVLASFERSWNLTRGKTWAMTGYLALTTFFFFIALLFFASILSGAGILVGSGEFVRGESVSLSGLLWEVGIQFLMQVFVALVLIPYLVFFYRDVYRGLSLRIKTGEKRTFK